MRRTAGLLKARARGGKALPGLLFFTDPARTPDIAAAMRTLPAGSGVVFRAFGATDAVAQGLELAKIAKDRRLILLTGADAALAWRIGAAGVHLPERLSGRAGVLKRAHPGWMVTAAAHSLTAARRALAAGADAVVLSTVFASRSPSAGPALGPIRLALLVRAAGGAVYALGGVNDHTAPRLVGTGVIGLAAIEAIRT